MELSYKVNNQTELIDALHNVGENKTIEFQSDVEIDQVLEVTKFCVIDLAFNTLTIKPSGMFNINSRITFRNGHIVSEAAVGMSVTGVGNTLRLSDDLIYEGDGTLVHVSQSGKLIVNGGLLDSNDTLSTCIVEGQGSSIDVVSGGIHGTMGPGVSVIDGGTLFIAGTGKVQTSATEFDADILYPAVIAQGVNNDGWASRVILTDRGAIVSASTSALKLVDGAQATLECGWISSYSTLAPALSVEGKDSIFRMVGGSILSQYTDAMLDCKLPAGFSNKIVVEGGCIAAANNVMEVTCEGVPDISISGIRFRGKLDPKYLPPGWEIIDGKIVPIGPHPGPDPGPDPGPEPKPDPYIVMAKSALTIYIAPTMRARYNKYAGNLLIYSHTYVDADGVSFTRVKYRLAGNGKALIGFVITSELDRSIKDGR